MIRFDAFEIDETRRELRRRGAVVPVQPKVLDLLVFLIRRRDRVVPQAEILRALWPDAVVTAASLARALKEARRALGDDGASQRWIRTLRGGGYRFLGEIAPAPASAAGYVGRPALLEALDAALARAMARIGGVVLLVGPSGIGKTRTATELARRAAEQGARVEWVRCADAQDAPPLWPFRRLSASLEGRTAPRDARDRFEAFDEIGAAIERASARGPLVIVADDLHDADPSSLSLLAFLAPDLAGLPVLVVATLRREAIEQRPDLARAWARLVRTDGVVGHELSPLDETELGRLVAQSAGVEPPPPAAVALHAATLGNPLWAEEVVRGGLAASARGGSLDWNVVLASGFEQALRARLARLAPSVRTALEAAAVLGDEFDAELVRSVTKCDVAEALEEARREGLLVASEPDLARHRFAHASFREALVAAIPFEARAALHARSAQALEARSDGDRDIEAIARHWLGAGDRADPARTVESAWRAGLRALDAHGWAQAARLFEGGVAFASRAGVATPERRCDLLLRLAEARTRLGDVARAREAAAIASALAAEHGWAVRAAEAALLWAGPPQYRLPDAEVSQRLADAHAALRSDHVGWAARVLARRAAEHTLDPDVSLIAALRRQAIDTAAASGDAEVLTEVLMTPWSGLWAHIDPAQRLALIGTCIDRAVAQGNRLAEARGRLLGLSERLGIGAFDAFDAEVDAVEALAAELHEPAGRYQVLLHRTTRALAAGDLGRAERIAEEALALGRRIEVAGAFDLFAATLALIRREQGRLRELAAVTPPLFVGHPSPAARVLHAWSLGEAGEIEAARALLDEIVRHDLDGLATQPTGIANAALLAEACFTLEERRPVALLEALLAPYSERIVLRGTLAAHGPASYFLGLLAWLRGEPARAAALLEHARSFCQRIGANGWGAHADHRAAWLRAERGDTAGARRLAARTARKASGLGLDALRAEAEALVARIG